MKKIFLLLVLFLLTLSCSGNDLVINDPETMTVDIETVMETITTASMNKAPFVEYKGETFLKKIAAADVVWIMDRTQMQYPNTIFLTLNDSDTHLFTHYRFNFSTQDCFFKDDWILMPEWETQDYGGGHIVETSYTQTPTKLDIIVA